MTMSHLHEWSILPLWDCGRVACIVGGCETERQGCQHGILNSSLPSGGPWLDTHCPSPVAVIHPSPLSPISIPTLS